MATRKKTENRIEIIDVTHITTTGGMIELEAEAAIEGSDGEMQPGTVCLRFNIESAGNAAARLHSQINLAKSQVRR